MNITFLIGNGFDMNLGLKTGYKDFLSFYLSEKPSNKLSKAIDKNIELWSNLEIQLGEYAGSIAEEERDSFFEEKEALENSLERYLRKICDIKMRIDVNGAEEFRKSVVEFANTLPAKEQEHYKNVMVGIRETVNYYFITFNYTDFLERITSSIKDPRAFGKHTSGSNVFSDPLQPPIHIHGTLDSEMILGVNDESQVGKEGIVAEQTIARYLVKPTVNESLGNQKISRCRRIIDNSRFVCVYGMSLGYTDKDWWKYIAEWLLKSSDNRLILFMHENNGEFISGAKMARLQDGVIERFLKMVDKEMDFAVLSLQIIVRFNSSIFSFEHIKMEDESHG